MTFSDTLKELKLMAAGDHMVLLYDNDAYNAEISAAYIGSRIMRNEKCIYIGGDDDQELLIEKLDLIVDIKGAIAKGQVSILNKEDVYSKDGYFSPDNMIALLKEMGLKAIEEGYKAFAITGEISWVLEYEDGFERIMEYEYKLNSEIFGKYPVSAVCRYSINRFTSEMIKNIIEVHPIIIWEGQIHDNPFYFDLVDVDEIDLNDYRVHSMLNTITSFTNTKSSFYRKLQEKEKENQELQFNLMESIIISLTSLLEIHDKYTKDHSENVAKIAEQIAKAMGLSQEEISNIYFAGLVHDIGKTIIPYDIINKKEELTKEEFEIIKKHSYYGYEALMKTEALKIIAELVLYHHERVDGTGYPCQISGDDIPIGSRILAVADAYDAMINDRPYHKAMQREEAIDELIKFQGSQFDEKVVGVFIKDVSSVYDAG